MSCPPSHLFVQSGAADCSTQIVCACTLIRNAPGPKTDDASMTPVDSQEPQAPGVVDESTSVGPSSADWFTTATGASTPAVKSCCQRRAGVTCGMVGPDGNCWLEPGSSAT